MCFHELMAIRIQRGRFATSQMTGTHTDATKSESTNENGETARRGQSRRCMSHLVQHVCQCTSKAASWKFELGRQRSTHLEITVNN